MRCAGLVAHSGKQGAAEFIGRIRRTLEENGVLVLGEDELRSEKEHPEMILSLGGDGTLLGCVPYALRTGAPLIGFNLGHLGFLTQGMPRDPEDAVRRLLDGRYIVEERMLISAALYRNGVRAGEWTGLNDAVISRNGFSRLMELRFLVDGQDAGLFMADGLIISTPTGSTGYSLSAGGPVVAPGVGCLIATPICPHSLQTRPMVADGGSILRIRLESGRKQRGALEIDGRPRFGLEDGDEVEIRRADRTLRLARFDGTSFFRLVREKLMEWSKEQDL